MAAPVADWDSIKDKDDQDRDKDNRDRDKYKDQDSDDGKPDTGDNPGDMGQPKAEVPTR